MAEEKRELRMFKGAAVNVALDLTDQNDEDEDLSTATAATVFIGCTEDEPPLVTIPTGDIAIVGGSLEFTVTEAQSNLLKTSTLIMQAEVAFPDGLNVTKTIYVRVAKRVGS